jgi:Helicase associated domain
VSRGYTKSMATGWVRGSWYNATPSAKAPWAPTATPTLRPSRPTREPHVGRWEEGFSRLHEYVPHHGDARVPVSYVVDGYRLGEWVHQQRKNYKNGILDADRQQRLQELPGWTWDASADRGLSLMRLHLLMSGSMG